MVAEPGEIAYLVLTERAAPYLLARVRWPDVAQAITVGNPDWLDDPGLFDLPYEPSAVPVSFAQATSVAAGWGRQLRAEAAEGVPSSSGGCPRTGLTCARRAACLWPRLVGKRRVSARRLRRLRSSQPKTDVGRPSPAGRRRALQWRTRRAGVDGPAANGRSQVAGGQAAPGVATERRRMCGCASTAGPTSCWGGPPFPSASSI